MVEDMWEFVHNRTSSQGHNGTRDRGTREGGVLDWIGMVLLEEIAEGRDNSV